MVGGTYRGRQHPMTQSPSSVRDSEEGASGGSRAGKALLRSRP